MLHGLKMDISCLCPAKPWRSGAQNSCPKLMLIWALFTLGYFLGVFTALAIFPPWVKEIEEQEKDALKPLQNISEDKIAEQKPAALTFEL